jgi:Nuclease-related domain
MPTIQDRGKAGQYLKHSAFEHTVWIIRWCMIAMALSGFCIGFLVAANFRWRFGWFQWLSEHGWPFSGLEIVVGGAVLLALRKVHAYTEKIAVDRARKLRGGQGEGLVAWYLNELPDDWYVFHNVKLWKKGDLDHVIVGPPGIFCISTKMHRGAYSLASDGTYLLNGKETDEITQAQKLAMELRNRLTGKLGDDVTWIQPVLIAPLTHVAFTTYQNKAWVLHEENLNDVFLDQRRKLNQAEIERYANAVKMIADAGAEL